MKKGFIISFFLYYTTCFAQNEYMRWIVPSAQDYEINFCDSVNILSLDTVGSGVTSPVLTAE